MCSAGRVTRSSAARAGNGCVCAPRSPMRGVRSRKRRQAVQPVEVFSTSWSQPLARGSGSFRLPVRSTKDGSPRTRISKPRPRLHDRLDRLHFPATFPEVFLRERRDSTASSGTHLGRRRRLRAQQFWVSRYPGLKSLASAESASAQHRAAAGCSAGGLRAAEQRERRRSESSSRALRRAVARPGERTPRFTRPSAERALDPRSDSGRLGTCSRGPWVLLRGVDAVRITVLDRGEFTSRPCCGTQVVGCFDDVRTPLHDHACRSEQRLAVTRRS